MKLLVNGRHLSGATYSGKQARFDPKNIESNFYIHPDSVTLRLDDSENLEWWLEVDLSKEVLEDLLRQMSEAT